MSRVLFVLSLASGALGIDLTQFFGIPPLRVAPEPFVAPEVVELIKWRQPVCILPAIGVLPCAAEVPVHRTGHDLFDGESRSARKVSSGDLETSSPMIDEKVEDKGNTPPIPSVSRSGKHLASGLLFGNRDHAIVKPPPIYVTKVLNLPVTATLIASGCFPDIGVPVCEGYHDRVKPCRHREQPTRIPVEIPVPQETTRIEPPKFEPANVTIIEQVPSTDHEETSLPEPIHEETTEHEIAPEPTDSPITPETIERDDAKVELQSPEIKGTSVHAEVDVQSNVVQTILDKKHDTVKTVLDKKHNAAQAILDKKHNVVQAIVDKKEEAVKGAVDKAQTAFKTISDAKQQVIQGIHNKHQIIVDKAQNAFKTITDAKQQVIQGIHDKHQGIVNRAQHAFKTISEAKQQVIQGIHDKGQGIVENLTRKKDGVVNAILAASAEKHKILQTVVDGKRTVIESIVNKTHDVVQNAIDAKLQIEQEIANQKQNLVQVIADAKQTAIQGIAGAKATVVKSVSDHLQESIGTASIAKPLLIGTIRQSLGLDEAATDESETGQFGDPVVVSLDERSKAGGLSDVSASSSGGFVEMPQTSVAVDAESSDIVPDDAEERTLGHFRKIFPKPHFSSVKSGLFKNIFKEASVNKSEETPHKLGLFNGLLSKVQEHGKVEKNPTSQPIGESTRPVSLTQEEASTNSFEEETDTDHDPIDAEPTEQTASNTPESTASKPVTLVLPPFSEESVLQEHTIQVETEAPSESELQEHTSQIESETPSLPEVHEEHTSEIEAPLKPEFEEHHIEIENETPSDSSTNTIVETQSEPHQEGFTFVGDVVIVGKSAGAGRTNETTIDQTEASEE